MASVQPRLNVIRVVPQLPTRAPQANIPPTLAEREALRTLVARYVVENGERLVPPLVLDELRANATRLVDTSGLNPVYVDYVGVLLSNEVWRDQLAAVPFERRLLLLPKC
ncbi:MAG: hypothetical protein AB7N65_28230, partial [Vicinamibacterales bacterium]